MEAATAQAAGPLLELLLEAQRRREDYGRSKRLGEAAGLLLDHIRGAGCPMVMAATPLAERVIGAALLIAGGDVEAASGHALSLASHVLVVDVAATSALSVEAAATRARMLGAERVDGVVLHPTEPEEQRFAVDAVDQLDLIL